MPVEPGAGTVSAVGTTRTVGVVGLGKMGLPIQRHIAAAGIAVTGFDLNMAATDAAKAAGLDVSATLADLAKASDTVLIVVDTESGVDAVTDAVLAAWQGTPGDSPHQRVIVVLATITVTAMRALAAKVEAAGYGILDGPLCKGEQAAVDGDLLILIGGDGEVFADCKPVLDCFTADFEHVGAVGAGQVGKLVNNLVLWASITSTSEGFWLAESFDVDLHKVRNAVLKSSGQTWALDTWYRKRDMPWAVKDLDQVLTEANRAGLSLPVTAVIHEAIKVVRERGLPGSTPP
jgi:3-hydroxyisobutyrate dehydrogenase-like beta-hydroxyacid dehydrogenase